jgi:hypothetical protein
LYTSSDNSPYIEVFKSIDPDNYVIWAPQVNGINVKQVSTTLSSITSPPITAPNPTSLAATTNGHSSSTSSPSSTNSDTTVVSASSISKKLSSGASAAIAVVATVLVIGVVLVAFSLWKRRRNAQMIINSEAVAMLAINSYDPSKKPGTVVVSSSRGTAGSLHEIGAEERPYELMADSQRHEVYGGDIDRHR